MLNMRHIMRYSLCRKKLNCLLAYPDPGVNNPQFVVRNRLFHTPELHLCPVTRILVLDGFVSLEILLPIIPIPDDLFTTSAASWGSVDWGS